MRGAMGTVVVSAPSRLNLRFVRNGQKSRVPRGYKPGNCGHHHCLLWWIHQAASSHAAAVPDRAQDKDSDVGRELIGWRLGEALVLFLYDDDFASDFSDE